MICVPAGYGVQKNVSNTGGVISTGVSTSKSTGENISHLNIHHCENNDPIMVLLIIYVSVVVISH